MKCGDRYSLQGGRGRCECVAHDAQAAFSYGFACVCHGFHSLSGVFLTRSHIWSTPAGSDGHSPTRRVLPGAVFSEASLEAGSRHPAFHVVSRWQRSAGPCPCPDPTKVTFVSLNHLWFAPHSHGDDMLRTLFAFHLKNRGLHLPCAARLTPRKGPVYPSFPMGPIG